MEAAFLRAEHVTLAGSMIPASSMLHHFPLRASYPTPFFSFFALSAITAPSIPAFSAIWRIGSSRARRTILNPTFSSSVRSSGIVLRALEASIRASPPPGTIPSSRAARVAAIVSSTRNFFSFISVSVLAPTLITATPPESLARRFCSCSLS